MSLRKLLYTATDRLRAPWIAALLVGGAYIGIGVVSVIPYGSQLRAGYLAVWILLSSLVIIRFVDRRPLATLGLQWNAFSARHCWNGLALGSGMLTTALFGAFVFGSARLVLPEMGILAAMPVLMVSLITYLLWATVEELIFRGYIFQSAIEQFPVSMVTIVFSVIFAAAHSGNPNATNLAIFNTFLAGLWLAGAYLRTRQLWLPIALHTGWNFMQGAVWGISVSGHDVGRHVFGVMLSGPEWLTGGEYGIEGGVLCTAVLIAGTILVQTSKVFQISPEQFALWHRVRYAEDRATSDRLFNILS